jgi:hypothetical protein
LAGGGRHKALEEATYAALTGDDGHGVQEAAEAGLGGFTVVDAMGAGVVSMGD